MTALRIRCCVPFCQHTRGRRKGDTEPLTESMSWICRDHWMAIPSRYRRAYARAGNWERGQPYRRKGAHPFRENEWAAWRLWQRCKRAAIERAVGI